MTTHIADLGWISLTQKTAKTQCSKRVACSLLAIDTDADCPECRASIDKDFASMLSVIEHLKSKGVDYEGALEAYTRSYPKRYQTVYFP